MRRRFMIDADGNLVDRDGAVLGKVVGLTLEITTKKGEGGSSPSAVPNIEKHPPSPKVEEIWQHYVTLFDASSKKLTTQRRRVIENALKERSVEDCKRALNGLAVSPHHNGQNDTGTKYLEVRYALKGNRQTGEGIDERIDKMIDMAARFGQQHANDVPSASDEKINQLVNKIRDGLAMPDSETAVANGKRAKASLEEMGYTVKRNGLRVLLTRESP